MHAERLMMQVLGLPHTRNASPNVHQQRQSCLSHSGLWEETEKSDPCCINVCPDYGKFAWSRRNLFYKIQVNAYANRLKNPTDMGRLSILIKSLILQKRLPSTLLAGVLLGQL